MAVLRIVVLHPGVKALLRGSGVQADLKARSDRVAEAANSAAGLDGGFVSEVNVGKNRARAVVVTATAEAMVAEATDRTLTRALDAAR